MVQKCWAGLIVHDVQLDKRNLKTITAQVMDSIKPPTKQHIIHAEAKDKANYLGDSELLP